MKFKALIALIAIVISIVISIVIKQNESSDLGFDIRENNGEIYVNMGEKTGWQTNKDQYGTFYMYNPKRGKPLCMVFYRREELVLEVRSTTSEVYDIHTDFAPICGKYMQQLNNSIIQEEWKKRLDSQN